MIAFVVQFMTIMGFIARVESLPPISYFAPKVESRQDYPTQFVEIPVNEMENTFRLKGRIVKPRSSQDNGRVIIFEHGGGKGFNPLNQFTFGQYDLARKGFTSIAFNHRGIGEEDGDTTFKSDGEFSEQTLRKRQVDLETVLQYAQQHEGITIDRIGIIAGSMGGQVASKLVRDHPNLGALVLLEPAAYADEVENKPFGPEFKAAINNDWRNQVEDFSSYSALKEYQGPLLTIYGSDDEVIPQHFRIPHAQAVESPHRALGVYVEIPGVGHVLLSEISKSRPSTLDALMYSSAVVNTFLSEALLPLPNNLLRREGRTPAKKTEKFTDRDAVHKVFLAYDFPPTKSDTVDTIMVLGTDKTTEPLSYAIRMEMLQKYASLYPKSEVIFTGNKTKRQLSDSTSIPEAIVMAQDSLLYGIESGRTKVETKSESLQENLINTIHLLSPITRSLLIIASSYSGRRIQFYLDKFFREHPEFSKLQFFIVDADLHKEDLPESLQQKLSLDSERETKKVAYEWERILRYRAKGDL